MDGSGPKPGAMAAIVNPARLRSSCPGVSDALLKGPHSTFFQVSSGSKPVMASTFLSVFLPRSFS